MNTLSHKYMTIPYLLETVNLIFKKAAKDTDVKNRLLEYVTKVRGWFKRRHAYYHAKQMTSAKLAKEQRPKPVHRETIDRMGGDNAGWGGHMCTCDWFMLTYGSHHNIIIILQLNVINLKVLKRVFADVIKLRIRMRLLALLMLRS